MKTSTGAIPGALEDKKMQASPEASPSDAMSLDSDQEKKKAQSSSVAPAPDSASLESDLVVWPPPTRRHQR